MGEFFSRFGAQFRGFYNSFDRGFLGLDFGTAIVAAFIIILLIVLYGIILLKLRGEVRRLRALETRFDSFREEVNLSIASIKVMAASPKTVKGVLNEMISAKGPKTERPRGVNPGSGESSEEYFESDENTKGGEVTSETETKGSPAVIKTEEQPEKASEIRKIMEGLEDESNPFYKEKAGQRSEEPLETKDVVYSKKADVSWDEKTALKGDKDASLGSKGSFSAAPESAVGGILNLKGDEADKETEAEKGKDIPLTEEISISLDDEPLKTIDAEGRLEERRGSERVDQKVDIELVYGDFSDFIKECSVNISKGGMFIKADSVYPVGTGIKLQVRLKDGYRLLNVDGEVIRVDEMPGNKGMGIRFLSFDEESGLLIEKIVEQQGG